MPDGIGDKWLRQDPIKRNRVFDEDRMEVHALLNEEALKNTKFIIWVNFPRETVPHQKDTVMAELMEDLEVGANTKYEHRIVLCEGYKDLRTELDILPEDIRGCFCP